MNSTPIEAAVKAAIRSSFNSRFSVGLAGGMALALSLALNGIACAQTEPAAAASSAPALEEITVTGSRIKRTNDFNTPTPTTVIDSSTMQTLGIVNVGEALTLSPANISTFTPANTGNSSFFAGSYIANLRGLNPYFGSRTLTLVNTRRVVQTNQGDSVDLNFIPQVMVERIDTVTGGASAAYGSGAIAGVVNVILDNKLEGVKLDGDFYQTSHSDNRDRHVGAAFGHSMFDDKLHFVIGGEYENQDALGCQDARTWCARDQGWYQQGLALPANVTEFGKASGLRANLNSNYGVFAQSPGSPTTVQATPDGTNTMPYTLGQVPYVGAQPNNAVIGGDGTPIYQYTNLNAPVNRGVITGMLSYALTDSINFTADVNWGKVQTTNYGQAAPDTNDFISSQNAYIQSDPALVNAVGPGRLLNKDWTTQVNQLTQTTTTVKRFSAGFDGKFGQSTWSWDAYGEYGLTERDQYLQDNRRYYSYSMATDSMINPVTGQPECRVTAFGGNVAAAAANAEMPISAGGGGFTPGYAGILDPTQANALAQGCVPVNPFGNQPMSAAAHDYSFGILDERLRYEQTVAAINASGEIFDGIGAGAFTLAAGYEWRQEVGHNDEVPCAANDLHCQYAIVDFLTQYGQPFGGAVTVDEGYLETNLPLLKNLPFAKLLEVDIAARESRYDNKALYGINATDQEFKHNLTTWKASVNYEAVDGVRFRGSQSRDARAANFRELYYGQIISPGGLFGFCGPAGTDPCQFNLTGNVNLRPETSDTTTLGIVLSPKDFLQGLNFSADWFHIKVKNAIEQASTTFTENNCRANVPGACDSIEFTPGSGGAAAYQAGANNISVITAQSFNGAFYEVRGVDFSLNYLMSLPDGSTLNTRALATWMDQQQFQAFPGGPVFNILGQTGNANSFLADYTPDAKWRGSLGLTWTKGQISLTPSMDFVGHGIQDYLGVTPDNPLYARVIARDPALNAYGYHAIPDNHVPSYFLFNFNATYNFENLASFKEAQLFVQVNNVLNKTPPFTSGAGAFGLGNAYGGTNPVFFDTFGLATRIGFRVKF